MSWFRVHRDGDKATLHIGDEIGFRIDASELLGELDGATAVELTINSGGGCGHTADALYNALRGRTPEAVVLGTCASSAALIAMAADRIVIHPEGRMMLHPPSVCAFATATELRAKADWLDTLTAAWIDRLCDRTGAPIETVCHWMAGPDVWFSAQEAIAVGLADALSEAGPTRRKTEIATEIPTMPNIVEEAHEEEALLLDLLRALGTVRTTDKKKLFKNLSAWFSTNIHEVTP